MNCLVCGNLKNQDPTKITVLGAITLCQTLGIQNNKIGQLADEIQRCRVCIDCTNKINQVRLLSDQMRKLETTAESFRKYFITRLEQPLKEETEQKRVLLDKSSVEIRYKHEITKGLRKSIKKGLGLKSVRRTLPQLKSDQKTPVTPSTYVSNGIPNDKASVQQTIPSNIVLPPGQLFYIGNAMDPSMDFLGMNRLRQPIILNNGIVNLDSPYTVLGEVVDANGSVIPPITADTGGNDTAANENPSETNGMQFDENQPRTPESGESAFDHETGQTEEEHNGLDILDDSSAPFEIVNILSPNINVDSPEFYGDSMPSPDINISFPVPNPH